MGSLHETLGERLKRLRLTAGHSRQEMARALDVSRAAISMWETDTTAPSPDHLFKLARYLRIPAESIWFGGEPEQPDLVTTPALQVAENWQKLDPKEKASFALLIERMAKYKDATTTSVKVPVNGTMNVHTQIHPADDGHEPGGFDTRDWQGPTIPGSYHVEPSKPPSGRRRKAGGTK